MNMFNVWAKKKFGITDIKFVGETPWYKRLMARAALAQREMRLQMANASEGWYMGNTLTMYPTDAYPTPYAYRYLLVCMGTAQSALPYALSYSIPTDRMCNLYPIANRSYIPLGIAIDQPGTAPDSAPYLTAVQMLGGGQARSSMGISDSQIPAGTLLVASSVTPGMLTAVPNIPGSYWSVGLGISNSEGNGAQVMFDPRPAVINVNVIT